MTPLPALPFHCQHFKSPLGEWEFLIAPPPPDLAGIVECFWISRGRVTFLYEKILPQNNVELMFNLRKPFGVPNRPPADRLFKRAWVAGMQREWLTVTPQYDPSEPSYLLSVRMPPLGAYRLLGMPLGSVAQNVFELDAVLGEAIAAVHQRLGDCEDAGGTVRGAVRLRTQPPRAQSREAARRRADRRRHADAHRRDRAHRNDLSLRVDQPQTPERPVRHATSG